MTTLMNGAVRLVTIQFSFSNLKLIPTCLRQVGEKPPSKFVAQKSKIPGEQILEPVEKVGCLSFLLDLALVGYVLVDALVEIRQKGRQQYATVKFIFSNAEHAVCSEEFLALRASAEQELRQLLKQAMWRVRAFLNHLFKDGEIVDEQYAISINLEARTPLIGGDGSPLFQWQRDENGERIGDGPIEIKPKKFLRIKNNDICVIDG